MDQDIKFMRQALALAQRGRGETAPNPCVGALLVWNGKIIGKGWHKRAGLPHAEVEAIQAAKQNGFFPRGATLYVTLEPCCTWGKTPPCTDIILAHGIRRIVLGTIDPNPKHQGKGLQFLRKAGVKITTGVLKEKCEALNQAWNHWIVHRTPWVIAKCGMTLDGKIATAKGESQWITSPASRRKAHGLRAGADAILVGINTVLQDDPLLTARGKFSLSEQPYRIVLDTSARIPLKSRILNPPHRTWIIVGPKAPAKKIARLQKVGVTVSVIPKTKEGLSIKAILRILGKANVVTLFVEGGGAVFDSFSRARCIHEVVFFIAPTVLGGAQSIKTVAGRGFPEWRESLALDNLQLQKVGPDLMVCGKIIL